MVEEEELRTARASQQGTPTGAADPSGPRASSAPPWKGAARYPVEEEEVDEPEEHAQPFPVRQKPENTRTLRSSTSSRVCSWTPPFSRSRILSRPAMRWARKLTPSFAMQCDAKR